MIVMTVSSVSCLVEVCREKEGRTEHRFGMYACVHVCMWYVCLVMGMTVSSVSCLAEACREKEGRTEHRFGMYACVHVCMYVVMSSGHVGRVERCFVCMCVGVYVCFYM
jgi:hypothetical protein